MLNINNHTLETFSFKLVKYFLFSLFFKCQSCNTLYSVKMRAVPSPQNILPKTDWRFSNNIYSLGNTVTSAGWGKLACLQFLTGNKQCSKQLLISTIHKSLAKITDASLKFKISSHFPSQQTNDGLYQKNMLQEKTQHGIKKKEGPYVVNPIQVQWLTSSYAEDEAYSPGK